MLSIGNQSKSGDSPRALMLPLCVIVLGKTELCKTLAATYYGSERDMVRIDMSEYGERVR